MHVLRPASCGVHGFTPRGAWSPDSTEPIPNVRPESVATYVATYKAAGYDFLKVHDEPIEIVDSIAAAARRIGLPIAGHVRGDIEHDLALGAYKSFEHLEGYDLSGSDTADARNFKLAGEVARV